MASDCLLGFYPPFQNFAYCSVIPADGLNLHPQIRRKLSGLVSLPVVTEAQLTAGRTLN